MPFKDLPEGQTHSYNDGCGEPAHNPTTPDPIEGANKLAEDIANHNLITMSEVRERLHALMAEAEEVGRVKGVKEAIEKLDPLTRYCRSKFVLHKTDCCNYYIGVENEPTVDMLLESDVKSSLTKLITK